MIPTPDIEIYVEAMIASKDAATPEESDRILRAAFPIDNKKRAEEAARFLADYVKDGSLPNMPLIERACWIGIHRFLTREEMNAALDTSRTMPLMTHHQAILIPTRGARLTT